MPTEVLPAGRRMSQLILSLWMPQAIYAAAELGIPDLLEAGALSGGAVAGRLRTDPDATARLLQALVTLDVLAERDGLFELTELGSCLRSDAAGSRRAWARLMGSPSVWGAWGRLVDCVRTGKPAQALVAPPPGAGHAESRPGPDVFDAMSGDRDAADVFHRAMADLTAEAAPAIVEAVDLAGARTVVDVGGGWGALLCAVLDRHPGLVGTVFDLEHARPGALAYFAARGVGARAGYTVGSFFDDPPPPADAYLLKSVIHDWDDEQSLRILRTLRRAMVNGSRLLMVEPPASRSRTNTPFDWMMSFSDLNMLVNVGGRERTEEEYRALLARAGLEVRDVLGEPPGFYRVFEAVAG